MTEEKEQTTLETAAESVENEQIEAVQPAASPAEADVSEQVQEALEKGERERATKPKKKRLPKDFAYYDQVVAHFAACGRCSYFLAGYRVIHGGENLETAVDNSKAGWLSLSWNHAMLELISKSFGIEIYADFLQYDGCCPDCGRHFIYQAGDTPKDAAVFRVQTRSRRR